MYETVRHRALVITAKTRLAEFIACVIGQTEPGTGKHRAETKGAGK